MLFLYRVINNLSPEINSESFEEKTTKIFTLHFNYQKYARKTRFGLNIVVMETNQRYGIYDLQITLYL